MQYKFQSQQSCPSQCLAKQAADTKSLTPKNILLWRGSGSKEQVRELWQVTWL